jgi:hypothetical protein
LSRWKREASVAALRASSLGRPVRCVSYCALVMTGRPVFSERKPLARYPVLWLFWLGPALPFTYRQM